MTTPSPPSSLYQSHLLLLLLFLLLPLLPQMYFNSTISDSTKLLKPLLVFGFVIAAALTGLTQITQHRSHPVDVYVGFLIGAFIAAYLVSATLSTAQGKMTTNVRGDN